MRNPKRIKPILDKLEKIWIKNPDLRLGQLIGNATEPIVLYYTEDDVLMSQLEDYYGREENHN